MLCSQSLAASPPLGASTKGSAAWCVDLLVSYRAVFVSLQRAFALYVCPPIPSSPLSLPWLSLLHLHTHTPGVYACLLAMPCALKMAPFVQEATTAVLKTSKSLGVSGHSWERGRCFFAAFLPLERMLTWHTT